MKSLHSLLNEKMKYSSKLIFGIEASQILDSAKKFLDTFIDSSALARPYFIKNNILYIICRSTIIAQEIKLQEKNFLNFINKNQNNIKIIRISLIQK